MPAPAMIDAAKAMAEAGRTKKWPKPVAAKPVTKAGGRRAALYGDK